MQLRKASLAPMARCLVTQSFREVGMHGAEAFDLHLPRDSKTNAPRFIQIWILSKIPGSHLKWNRRFSQDDRHNRLFEILSPEGGPISR